eukprot:gnl/Chilomastix_cuspidata/4514.p1 GENE.gnl/Chilomastix_cuspidata/4514~~gnl/Chilomastix_cuspidata/4514.p1  ORF type:complete len:563 (+),score=187.13 gnl/Chilomastix_cuspidata/4514:50-1738(+)
MDENLFELDPYDVPEYLVPELNRIFELYEIEERKDLDLLTNIMKQVQKLHVSDTLWNPNTFEYIKKLLENTQAHMEDMKLAAMSLKDGKKGIGTAGILDIELPLPVCATPLTPPVFERAVEFARRGQEAEEARAGVAGLRLDMMRKDLRCHALVLRDDIKRSHEAAAKARSKLIEFNKSVQNDRVAHALMLAARTPDVSLRGEVEERRAYTVSAVEDLRATTASYARWRARAERLRVVACVQHAVGDLRTLRFVRVTSAEVYGPAASVDDFKAFPGADDAACETGPLVERAGGLRVSRSAPVLEGLPRAGMYDCVASLSACGTMCVVRNAGMRRAELLLVAAGARTVRRRLAVPRLEWACVCGDRLFVCTRKAAVVRHAVLAAVFDGLPLAEFQQLQLPKRGWCAATDRAGDGLIVVHSEPRNRLLRLDWRRRRCSEVTCDRDLSSIGGLSSIRVPGVLCVAREWGFIRSSTVAVLEDGSTRELTQRLKGRPTMLPSATCPRNLASAALTDSDSLGLFYKIKGPFPTPVKSHGQSLLRFFRDVFLCYNLETQTWYALRVRVP